MRIFRSKKNINDRVEGRFQTAVNLIKDLDKQEYERLVKGMDLAWQAYDAMRKVQAIEEKELDDIEQLEKVMEGEE